MCDLTVVDKQQDERGLLEVGRAGGRQAGEPVCPLEGFPPEYPNCVCEQGF